MPPVPKPSQKAKQAKAPKPRTRVKRVNPERQARVRDRAYLEWIVTRGCIVGPYKGEVLGTRCFSPYPDRQKFEPMHVKTRGSGGGDRANTVCGCQLHHDEQEGDTEGFERTYGINLALEAAKLYVDFLEREAQIKHFHSGAER